MVSQALVVFSGRADFLWQRLLRPGFRHCAVVIGDGDRWIVLEPLADRLQVRSFAMSAEKLLEVLEGRGLMVVPATLTRCPGSPRFFGIWSCVALVKRTLGIRGTWIFTPWQLFRHLQKKNKKKILERDQNRNISSFEDARSVPEAQGVPTPEWKNGLA